MQVAFSLLWTLYRQVLQAGFPLTFSKTSAPMLHIGTLTELLVATSVIDCAMKRVLQEADMTWWYAMR